MLVCEHRTGRGLKVLSATAYHRISELLCNKLWVSKLYYLGVWPSGHEPTSYFSRWSGSPVNGAFIAHVHDIDELTLVNEPLDIMLDSSFGRVQTLGQEFPVQGFAFG